MAERLWVIWCDGSDDGCIMQHDLEGSISRRLISTTQFPVIHFADRPVTRANVLAFLRLVVRADDDRIDEDPVVWRRVYFLNIRVRALAKTLHIKDPGHPARMDRAFVLASVAGLPNSVPMRKQAYDWARRGPKKKEE
jgi:hypothetical protein